MSAVNPAVATMVAAIAGVLGTLCAPLLSQRLNLSQRREEQASQERRRSYEERRAAYVAMNRASREFHDRLKYALHRIREGVFTAQNRADLEDSRLAYRNCYAEAQMVAPELVLSASRELNSLLTYTYAEVNRILERDSKSGEVFESLRVHQLKSAEEKLRKMTLIMRADLGITDNAVEEL